MSIRRQARYSHLNALRSDPSVSPRLFDLLSLLLEDLDMLEASPILAQPTKPPPRRPTPPAWKADRVREALDRGRDPEKGGPDDAA